MNNVKSKIVRTLVYSFCLAALESIANEDVFYGSVGLHRAEWDLGLGFDESDTGLFSLDIGYMITRTIGLEIGYQDFGEFEVTGNGSANVEGDAFKISLLAMIPANERFSVYGEIGIDFWDDETTIENVPGFGSANASDDGSDIFFGGGVQLMFRENVAGFIEYKSHKLRDADVDTVGAGIKYFIKNGF